MAWDTDKILEDLKTGIGLTPPGAIGKGIAGIAGKIKGNEAEIMKVIRELLKITPPGQAAEVVKLIVNRYRIDPDVAQRMVVNEMADANIPTDPSGKADEGYRPEIGIESSAEDTSVMPDTSGIDLSDPDIRRQIENLRSKPGRLPGPIDTGERRSDAIRFPDLVGEGDGRTMEEKYPGARYRVPPEDRDYSFMQDVMPMFKRELTEEDYFPQGMMIPPSMTDKLSIPMPMFNQGGRVGLANGTMMASAPDPMDERNQVM